MNTQHFTMDELERDLLCNTKHNSIDVDHSRTCSSDVTLISYLRTGINGTTSNIDLTLLYSDNNDTMGSLRGGSILYPDCLVASKLEIDTTTESSLSSVHSFSRSTLVSTFSEDSSLITIKGAFSDRPPTHQPQPRTIKKVFTNLDTWAGNQQQRHEELGYVDF